jgi:hypothetical protein
MDIISWSYRFVPAISSRAGYERRRSRAIHCRQFGFAISFNYAFFSESAVFSIFSAQREQRRESGIFSPNLLMMPPVRHSWQVALLECCIKPK